MKKFIAILLIGIACVGCGKEEETEKNLTLNSKSELYVLPKGMKVVNITDRSYDIKGVLLRNMKAGEKAETYRWVSLYNGHTITLQETE